MEDGKKLLGPAALNRLFVNSGNICGAKSTDGVQSRYTYLDGIALYASYLAEVEGDFNLKVHVAKKLSDIKLTLDPAVRNYIISNNKKIDIRGPVFINIISEKH